MSEWPEEVPILTAEDICKCNFDGPNDTHCLLGWCDVVFQRSCRGRITETNNKLAAAMRKIADVIADETGREIPIPVFNDERWRRRSTIARVWNKAIARLGYVVGNPEAGD